MKTPVFFTENHQKRWIILIQNTILSSLMCFMVEMVLRGTGHVFSHIDFMNQVIPQSKAQRFFPSLQKSHSETCRKYQLCNVNNKLASKIKVGRGFMTTDLQTDCLSIGT